MYFGETHQMHVKCWLMFLRCYMCIKKLSSLGGLVHKKADDVSWPLAGELASKEQNNNWWRSFAWILWTWVFSDTCSCTAGGIGTESASQANLRPGKLGQLLRAVNSRQWDNDSSQPWGPKADVLILEDWTQFPGWLPNSSQQTRPPPLTQSPLSHTASFMNYLARFLIKPNFPGLVRRMDSLDLGASASWHVVCVIKASEARIRNRSVDLGVENKRWLLIPHRYPTQAGNPGEKSQRYRAQMTASWGRFWPQLSLIADASSIKGRS